MKRIIYSIFAASLLLTSCIVDPALKEVPKSQLSPENCYTNLAGFESAIADLYRVNKAFVNSKVYYGVAGDLFQNRTDDTKDGKAQYLPGGVNFLAFNAGSEEPKDVWVDLYSMIARANTIITRAETEKVTDWSELQKNQIIAEAKFFRAYAYHHLANLFGGVPILDKETTAAKYNYQSTTREAVYKFCREDLEFAVLYMKDASELVGGKAPVAAAWHYLAEVDIMLGDYKAAISAASKVIDDPDYYLMTERFGKRKTYKFAGYDYQGAKESWGDVYWDLYQEGNMNFQEGNHEAIWNVIQTYNVVGAGDTQGFSVPVGGGASHTNDINSKVNFPQDELWARGSSEQFPTDYLGQQIWNYKGDFDRDIRNSKYNMQREFYWTNPASAFYGQKITKESMKLPGSYFKYTQPALMKGITTIPYGRDLPDEYSGAKTDGNVIFKDWYILRLSETYLLRAEAYMRDGDATKAAADINVVRGRAKATPVNGSDVNMDLILDERARELFDEEFRFSTLCRVGKLAEYLNKYNPYIIQEKFTCPAHYNLWPIPISEIEANKEGGLVQNSGY